MKEPIRSMSILKPHPGMEQELIAFLCEFYSMMYDKRYSRDMLFKDLKQTGVYVHVRIWFSPEARETAMHDSDVHRYWMKLPELGDVTEIWEELEPIFSTERSVVADSEHGGV
jgi:hypothetical protein